MLEALAAYLGLFVVALGAATILPLQSEWLVVALLVQGDRPWQTIVIVASLGNILGSIVNWLLGRSLMRFQEKRWFPASQKNLARAEVWYRRYGKGSLLLSWVPIVGDPLTVIAGVLREPLWSFVILVGIAKIGRYLALTALTLSWLK